MKNRYITLYLLVTILFFGFLYRIILSSFGINEIIWDMKNYHLHALELLSGKLTSDCCTKNIGYAAFLSFIYYIFGPNNLFAIIIIQSIIDLIIAILVYSIVKKKFGGRAGIYSFIIYIINPFTSSYVGLRLSEIVSLFYITLIAYFISLPTFKKYKRYWFIFGFILGLLVFTRMQFLYFSMLLIFVFAIVFFKKFNRTYFLIFSITGFLIASSYSLFSNYKNYKVVGLYPPYMIKHFALYGNFYNDVRHQDIVIGSIIMNPKRRKLLFEYYDVRNSDFRKIPLLEKKYKALFIQRIKKDWSLFLKNTFRNIVWLWDRNHLFLYKDIFYPSDIWPLRIINISLMSLFFIGVTDNIIRKKRKIFSDLLSLYTILLFLYITFTFSLVSNETRHTLIFFPLIVLWAGYGFSRILSRFKYTKKT